MVLLIDIFKVCIYNMVKSMSIRVEDIKRIGL